MTQQLTRNTLEGHGGYMRWILDLSVRAKLALSFGLMILALVLTIAIAYNGISAIERSQDTLVYRELPIVSDLLELKADENRLRAQFLQLMLSTTPEQRQALEQEIKGRRTDIDETLRRLSAAGSNDPKFAARFDALKSALAAYRQTRDLQMSLVHAGKSAEARRLSLGIQEERYETIRSIAKTLGEEARERATVMAMQSKERAQESVKLFVCVGGTALLLAIVLALLLNRIIVGPLRAIAGSAAKIASKDLVTAIEDQGRRDEFGVLATTFNAMAENLRQLIAEVQQGAQVLASATGEISVSTSQVAAGAAETAAAVSQTTTTVEEVKQTAQIASDKARYVCDTAQKTAQVSQGGRRSLEDSIDAMHRIQEQMESIAQSIVRLSEQGQAIGEIIATVNDLAEQSNLLAVNAAVEAAKAGEQGKGFAVVAQEVKSLAGQSKQATAQVRAILGDIQKATGTAVMAAEQGSKAVDSGMHLSSQVAGSIAALGDSIEEAARAATQIAASAQQQMVGMDQIVQAMQNIKQASMQNVAGTRQSEGAAQDLHQLGLKLQRLVEQYRV